MRNCLADLSLHSCQFACKLDMHDDYFIKRKKNYENIKIKLILLDDD